MIGRFPARASGLLAGTVVLAALALPAAALASDVTEFSAQDSGVRAPGGPPRVVPRGVPGPRGPVGAPRHMGAPGGVAVAPRVGDGGRRYGGPGPGFRGPAPGYVAPGYRGPGPGFRGPAVGFGPGWRGPHYRGYAFVRGRHYVRRGGALLPLVGLGALGAIYVGSRYYTPYAYVDVPAGPACAGPTEDGMCELRLTEVPLETGGAELQCVAYCPQ